MLKLITAATAEPLTLAEVKNHCAIDSDDFDDLLTSYIAAVRAHVERITNRALCAQTWELRLSGFPSVIELPLPPFQSVTSITYTDTAGTTQTLASYEISGVGGDQPAEIRPAFGTRWPATRDVPEAVKVRFVAGYESDGASPPNPAANVPPDLKAAMLQMIGDAFANRETVSSDQTYLIPIPGSAKAMLLPFKVWTLP
jgi:uncharacterized phiE125 gp8 family phage protein